MTATNKSGEYILYRTTLTSPAPRLLARDAGGETEGVLLNETVPAWVVDIVVEKKLPKFIKVSFKRSQLE